MRILIRKTMLEATIMKTINNIERQNNVQGDYHEIHNIIVNSIDYKALLEDINELESDIQNATTDEIRLKKLEKLSKKKQKLQLFKESVFWLYNWLYKEFCRVPLNTERLKQAKACFDAGQFREADALLKVEDIASEVKQLQDDQRNKKQELAQINASLIDKSNEYLIKAQIKTTFYSDPNWFEESKKYFEEALNVVRTVNVLFTYAKFLQEHNQFSEAIDRKSTRLNSSH